MRQNTKALEEYSQPKKANHKESGMAWYKVIWVDVVVVMA